MKLVFITLSLFWSNSLFAHGNKKTDYDSEGFEIISSGPSEEVLSDINQQYKRKVAPIFSQKCLMCHGKLDEFPWYYSIPGVKQLIDRDIKEAKEHMDMTEGFPFKGHGSALDDLRAIERVLDKGSMPPLQYRVIHWSSKLNESERSNVKEWIDQARKMLSNN